jgi:eukaryotic-like serine/threonine-protein kinase
MSPEQCRGEAVTCATDVYGLAVTLYEALTGLLPFPRSRRRRQFPQLKTDPQPLRSTTSSIPKEFEAVVMACLSRDPSARPSSPATLLPTLHRFIRHGPRMWPARFDPVAAGSLD